MTNQPRILVAGLGGTGVEALLQLKLLFAGEVPPHIGLFGVDTEAPKELANAALNELEFARLVVSDLTDVLRNPENAHLLEWFPGISSFPIHSVIHGAAQIRSVGRLALHAQASHFLKQLRNCISRLTDRGRLREMSKSESIDDQGSIEVYVLASLCGGTGSGITLDVARLIREELRDAPGVRIFGVLLLPGAFRHLPGTAMVQTNAYAALKELEYLSEGEADINIRFGQNYSLRIDRSPFDQVFLIDSIGESFDTESNIQQLGRQMAWLPYLMASSGFGAHVRGILHNLIPQLQVQDPIHGKRAIYASFGVASLEIPACAISAAKRKFEISLIESLMEGSDYPRTELMDRVRKVVAECEAVDFPAILEISIFEFEHSPSLGRSTLEDIVRGGVAAAEVRARADAGNILDDLTQMTARLVSELMDGARRRPGMLTPARCEIERLSRELSELQEQIRGGTGAEPREKIRQALQGLDEAFDSRWNKRRRRIEAAWALKKSLNDQLLPDLYRREIRKAAADAVGSIVDKLLEARDQCKSAIENLSAVKERLKAAEDRAELPPGPATRYIRAEELPELPPAPHEFLAAQPEVGLLCSGSDLVSRIAEYSAARFAAACQPRGEYSATTLLSAKTEMYLSELRRFSVPSWSFNLSKMPIDRRPEHGLLEVLSVDVLSGEISTATARYSSLGKVDNGRWDQNTFLQIRAGLPLFALTRADELWRSYCEASPEKRVLSHLDRWWVGWFEFVDHSFVPALVRFFARCLAANVIHTGTAELAFTANKRYEWRSYTAAYEALAAEPELCAAAERAFATGNCPDLGAYTASASKLIDLLMQSLLSMEDRPLVEALYRESLRLGAGEHRAPMRARAS